MIYEEEYQSAQVFKFPKIYIVSIPLLFSRKIHITKVVFLHNSIKLSEAHFNYFYFLEIYKDLKNGSVEQKKGSNDFSYCEIYRIFNISNESVNSPHLGVSLPIKINNVIKMNDDRSP